MMRIFALLIICGLNNIPVFPQNLDYYLPQTIQYDQGIPTPESVLGYQVGSWHVSHDKLVQYMQVLTSASDRVSVETYGSTYEGRPLLLLTITSPQNHQDLQSIQTQHLKLSQGEAEDLDISAMPVVVWMGYSVHGNEASGSNAALLAAYYLAAAQGEAIEDLLQHAIILLDPSINPDGLNRFASWVNSHKSKTPDSNPQSLEHTEAWPRGRTNHYWFDLNRDWLPLQHPESQGRLVKFHQWKPNVLTDHHEMGRNRTFFFQPGVPARNHPLTPDGTFELTKAIAAYHAQALDKIGSLYYSEEGYDDFYFGKGSTYPDINGGIGILFEQASARGHVQESDNGLLTFPFAIRNHFTTTLSTLEAARNLRQELLEHQRNFYESAHQQANSDQVKAFLFQEEDQVRVFEFLQLLRRHQIEVFHLGKNSSISLKNYLTDYSYVVPLSQPQYRLVKAIFEKRTTFSDSLFYDISAWTMPLAFNLDFSTVDGRNYSSAMLGQRVEKPQFPTGSVSGSSNAYGFSFNWQGYYAPRALYRILKRNLIAKVVTEPMQLESGETLAPGAILVPASNQSLAASEILELAQTIAREDGLDIKALHTGFSSKGLSWGSPSLETVKLPKILVMAEGDINSYEVGEVWHLLDQRMDIPMTMVSQNDIGKLDLNKYNVIVMVHGQYKGLDIGAIKKLQTWVTAGGTLVAWKNGAKWLSDKKISKAVYKKQEADTTSLFAYGDRKKYSGAQVIGGAIFQTQGDLSHPLLFGFKRRELAVFRNHDLFLERSKNPFTNPLIYSDNPLLSGYISLKKLEKLKNTPAVEINHVGSGKVISFTDNPNFRAYWFGTNKLFLNALFFGPLVDSEDIK